MLAHGANFNFSIWYLALHGIDDEAKIREIQQSYVTYQESLVVKLMLKHLRQRNLSAPFNALLVATKIPLESPEMTALHYSLVTKGDFAHVERMLRDFKDQGRFDEFISEVYI